MLFIQNGHRVVDGDHADQPFTCVYDRGRNQMVLVEGIGDLALVLQNGDGAEAVFGDRGHGHLARAAHQAAQGDIACRAHPWVNQDHVIELFGQIVLRPQKINRLSNVPMIRCHDQLALHQATGGFLGIGQRLFDHDAVVVVQSVQNGFGLWIVEVFDQVDNVVGFQIAHGLGQNGGLHRTNHVFAQAFIQFGQDLAVKLGPVQAHERVAIIVGQLFNKVGDVSGMQRFKQGLKRKGVLGF